MNKACGSVADRTRPGELLRLVADGLAGCGLDVRLSESTEGSRLTIACEAGQCAVSVSDWGYAELEYCPRSGGADPELAADLATTLLTGRAGQHPRLGRGYERDGITFKGIAALELKARGLDVELAVYPDEDYFEAHAEIVVTSPGSEEDAKVCITDDGCLTWMRDYRAEAATIISGPEFCGWIADPASVAAAVVETITLAMSCPCPARQGGAGMSGAVWCEDLKEGHVWDERKAIVVTSGPDTFHFCAQHLSSAFTAAVNHAEQRGMCEILVPSYGAFELKASGPRQRPAAGTAPQPQPTNYGGRA